MTPFEFFGVVAVGSFLFLMVAVGVACFRNRNRRDKW